MFASAQKNGLQLDDPEPVLEKLDTVALTKQRCKKALKLGTLLIAIGLVSCALFTVVASGLSFIRHGYDLSTRLDNLFQQVRQFSPSLCFSSFKLRAGYPRELWSPYRAVVS